MSKDKKEIEQQEIKQENQLDFHYIARNYSRSNVQPMWSTSSNKTNNQYTVEQISKLLSNPYNNYKQLQAVSGYLLANNSNYENIVDYFANIMAFDYVLYPTALTDKKVTVRNRLIESAKIISKMSIHSMFPHMLKQALLYGESYWYDLSDGDNTIIVEIPRELCILSHINDDNMWIYYVDLSLITATQVYELPEEIQIAYRRYTDGGKPKGKREEDGLTHLPKSYYEVSSKGFAIFAHMNKKAHDYPMFAHMFIDLTTLGQDKSYFNTYIRENNVKTLHQQIPLDEDTGLPVLPKEVIEAYHNASKESVGSNISIMTNPFKVEGISLDGSQQSTINVVDHDLKLVQNDSGISETIFNANTTNGLGYSTKADSARMYPLLYFFTNYVNFKIKSQKFAVEFLRVNIFDEKDMHSEYRTDLLSGGSRSLFMSTSGVDLYSYVNLVEMEDLLDIDELLKPKINGSQLNGMEDTNPNGRPPKQEGKKTDSTVVVDGYK